MVYRLFIPLQEFTKIRHYMIVGFAHVLFAAFIAWLLFPLNIGVMTVLLTVVFGTPFVYTLFMQESALMPHFKDKDFKVFLHAIFAFFFGQVAAFVLLYLALPFELARDVFIDGIFAPHVLDFIQQTGTANLSLAFFDNVRYLLIAILLSIMYGAGAVFMICIASLHTAVIIVELATIAPTLAFGGVLFLLLQVVGYIGIGAAIAIFIQTAKTHPATKIARKINKQVTKIFTYSLLLLLLGIVFELVLLRF